MYTDYEKHIAIRYIIALYIEHKEEEFRRSQYFLKHRNNKARIESVNKPVINAKTLQKLQEEFWYGLKIMEDVDSIIRKLKSEKKARVTAELDLYYKKNPCSHMIEAMAYYFVIENRFPKEIELSNNQEIIKSQIEKIFADEEILREWKVVYSILLETLPSLHECQNIIQSRQLKR